MTSNLIHRFQTPIERRIASALIACLAIGALGVVMLVGGHGIAPVGYLMFKSVSSWWTGHGGAPGIWGVPVGFAFAGAFFALGASFVPSERGFALSGVVGYFLLVVAMTKFVGGSEAGLVTLVTAIPFGAIVVMRAWIFGARAFAGGLPGVLAELEVWFRFLERTLVWSRWPMLFIAIVAFTLVVLSGRFRGTGYRVLFRADGPTMTAYWQPGTLDIAVFPWRQEPGTYSFSGGESSWRWWAWSSDLQGGSRPITLQVTLWPFGALATAAACFGFWKRHRRSEAAAV